ncbi:MAG TPA: hypothetical protein VHW72_02885, partial [Candidatus Angelobacter sp.]|nr:hypothetical protein [Candidatus Angelobacter sp.]
MTLATGAALIPLLPDVGCPQVVQKLVSGASVAPHDLQTALDEEVDEAAGMGSASAAIGGGMVATISGGPLEMGAV